MFPSSRWVWGLQVKLQVFQSGTAYFLLSNSVVRTFVTSLIVLQMFYLNFFISFCPVFDVLQPQISRRESRTFKILAKIHSDLVTLFVCGWYVLILTFDDVTSFVGGETRGVFNPLVGSVKIVRRVRVEKLVCEISKLYFVV